MWRNKFLDKQELVVVTYGACFSAENIRKNLWVEELSKQLKKDGYKVKFLINGQGGKNSSWGVDNVEDRVVKHNPDLVLLEFGGTDSKNVEGVEIRKSVSNMKKIINSIKNECDSEIVLLSTLPNVLKGRLKSIRGYFEAHKNLSVKQGLEFVDVCKYFDDLERTDLLKYNLSLTNDRGHITKYGACEILVPFLKRIFTNDK